MFVALTEISLINSDILIERARDFTRLKTQRSTPQGDYGQNHRVQSKEGYGSLGIRLFCISPTSASFTDPTFPIEANKPDHS